jgi:D-3-phosphoglycerate dehydrogenase
LITSEANFNSVAEHILGLMFALAKDIPMLDARVRAGHWDKADYRGMELTGKTLGLIGFGRIGRRVSELVTPLRMEVLVYDPFLNVDGFPAGLTRVQALDDLLEKSDIVSLHCPLTEKTRGLMGTAQFKTMKKTAWLINAARGGVVDEEALIAALKSGEIAAAGLDTFSKEPPEDLSRLCEAGKTVLSPHIAGSTEESRKRMGVDAVRNILTILEGRKPDKQCVINPEVFERG